MDKIVRNFERYNKLKKEGFVDYFLDLTKTNKELIPNEEIPYDAMPVSSVNSYPSKHLQKNTKTVVKNNKSIIMVDKKAVDYFHPDKIDNTKFWKTATNYFPFSPIAGNLSLEDYKKMSSLTLIEFTGIVNYGLIKTAHILNAIPEVEKIYEAHPAAKILEIGPGYGSLISYLSIRGLSIENYYGIDINPLFKHERLFKCDGKNIPKQIPSELDCVYSVNVFQHLSKKQRLSYLRQAHIVLKRGGKFIFSNFVVTPENRNRDYWRIKDRRGRNYIAFFNQYTEADVLEELVEIFEDIGYHHEIIFNAPDYTNHLAFSLTKMD